MRKPSPHTGLAVIAWFKLIKALVLLLVGASLLRLVDADIAAFLAPAMNVFHLHVHSRLLHSLLLLTVLSPHHVFVMAYASLSYAALLLVEGFGLWLQASWAAYLTVISTSLFLPIEFDEVFRHASVAHVAVLLINVGIVVYLVVQLGVRSLSGQRQPPPQVDP
jgi:uncharacterized membrane protein (DUF2068 family)